MVDGKMKPPPYPFTAPIVQFQTKVYHSNVDGDTGFICQCEGCNRVLTGGAEWKPNLSAARIVKQIASGVYLSTHSTDCPLRSDVAELYNSNRLQHDENARAWTKKYAIPGNTRHEFTENESILAALFLWWYTGNEKKSMTVLSKLLQCTTSNHHQQYTSSLLQIQNILDRETVETAWRSRWFAKGKQTKIVDDFMKEEYASLLLNESFVDKWTNVTEEQLDDLPVWLLLSLLILFDQVPRNIFRGTYKKLLIVSYLLFTMIYLTT
jgi:hypothetical protein